MQRYNVIIVDDEKHPRELLADLLVTHFPEIEIRAHCTSADEATKAIEIHSPELVFLDVEMPGKTGFQLLEALPEISFEIIFTTSYSKYAVDAFKVSALDYLLKPVEINELREAIGKFKARLALHHSHQQIENLLMNIRSTNDDTQKIALPTSNGYLFVRIADIVRCMSQNVYAIFHLADKSQVVVSRTLKECEDMLQRFGFQRIHQSHLINMRYVKRYIKGEGGEVEMEDNTRLDVSRRKKEEFLEAMQRL
ncbi:MAG: LytTR family DNA-binding domain-containing protein [Flavobacteriales bacterium]|nr:LytTR family DNA-binding domain-containing protein [Flavobacteriales bacterium]